MSKDGLRMRRGPAGHLKTRANVFCRRARNLPSPCGRSIRRVSPNCFNSSSFTVLVGRDAFDPRGRFRSVGRVRLEERRRFIRPPVLQSPLLATQRVVQVAADDRGGQAGFPTELGISVRRAPGRSVARRWGSCWYRRRAAQSAPAYLTGRLAAWCAKRARMRAFGWFL